MKGYLFNFYKFSPTTVDSSDITSDDFVRSIVWSSFDRLEIREITKFEEYRLSKFSEKNWLGERQFAMVYEFDNNYKKLIYNNEDSDECRFVFDIATVEENIEQCDLRFFGITFIDFTPEVHDFLYNNANYSDTEHPGEKIHETLQTAIDYIIKENNIVNPISYEIYGVLGGQDAVIIWLANQFEDIAKSIEALRNSKTVNEKAVIANVYTTIGLKDVNNKAIKYDDVIGKLNVKLTKKDSYDNGIFKKDIQRVLPQLKEDEFNCSILFGEHDLMFTIEGKHLVQELYQRDGLFNSKSPNFKVNFIQSKTEITVQGNFENIKNYTFLMNVHDIETKVLSNNQTTKYVELIDKISLSACFKKASYLQETLWLLYEDFLKNSMSSFSYPWISDLDFQFENCLVYLSLMVDSQMDNDKKYKNIHQLISSMRQMMLHVAQANRIFFEIPNTHLKHTGAYSKILHTYYGIVKLYLGLSYSIHKYDNQTPIVPFITFDVTPIAKSKFCDMVEGFKNNIIKIELPYEALVDISKYMKLLAHEIYHYIAPIDRVARNLLVGRLSFSIILGQMGRIYIEKKVAEKLSDYPKEIKKKEEKAKWDERFNIIANLIRISALTIPDFEEILRKEILDYRDNAEWKEYFVKFSRAMVMGLKGKSNISTQLYHLIQNLDETNEGLDETTVKLIKKAKKIEEDEFYEWLKSASPIKEVRAEDSDLRYSLREAMADYFMLQVTEMDIDEYVELVYKYRGMVSKNPQHMKQNYRVTLIIFLYFGKVIKEQIIFQEKPANEIIAELASWFENKYGWEEEICKWIANEYVPFILGLGIYGEVFEQYFEQLDFQRLAKEKFHPDFVRQLEKIRSLLNKGASDSEKITEFDKNIYFIEKLQNQNELRRLEDNMRYYPPENRPIFELAYKNNVPFIEHDLKKDFFVSSKVNSLEGLMKALKNVIRDISEEKENAPIWFRGHTNKNYYLIPSLYRMLDQKSKFYDISMRDTLKSLTELFKAKAFNAPELIGDKDRAETNCLISMQHYSVPTNILDWSTSAFVAMYFALENEINGKEVKIEEDENAIIFLLNPIRLNIAREALKSSYAARGKKVDLKFPILALSEDERFEEYLPTYMDKNGGKEEEYPLAVYAPFVNQRIKAQRGTFVMFGLDNSGILIPEENARDYKEETLEKMQEEYKELCADEKNHLIYKPFLTYVEISKEAKKDIAMCLKELGIGKANIYPELENISQELIKEVKAYFEVKRE